MTLEARDALGVCSRIPERVQRGPGSRSAPQEGFWPVAGGSAQGRGYWEGGPGHRRQGTNGL